MPNIKNILDLLKVKPGTQERMILEREAYQFLRMKFFYPNGGAQDSDHEAALIARAKAAVDEENATGLKEISLAAADSVVADIGAPDVNSVTGLLVQLDTIIGENGEVVFWQEKGVVYISADVALEYCQMELVEFNRNPYKLLRNLTNVDLFEVVDLSPSKLNEFLEMHLNFPDKYKIVFR